MQLRYTGPLLTVLFGLAWACGGEPTDGGSPIGNGTYPEAPFPNGGYTYLGGMGGMGGMGGGGMGGVGGIDCSANNTCMMGEPLGAVSGDTGNDTATAGGFTNEFFLVDVTEDDSGVTGAPMKVVATLAVPNNVNFDLYAYLDPDNPTLPCAAPYASSTNLAGNESIELEWGEGGVPNGEIDSRDVVFEVRLADPMCIPGQEWSLQIAGNVP